MSELEGHGGAQEPEALETTQESEEETKPRRVRLSSDREGVTWKMKIGDLNGVQLGEATMPPEGGYHVKAYLTTGEYEDGTLGEVFLRPDKEGSFLRGSLDGFALLLSIALQHGVPLEVIARKFMHVRFEPSGLTNDKSVPMSKSFLDFMFRKLALRYLDAEALERLGVEDKSPEAQQQRQEEEDATEENTKAWRPTLSGEPFNKKKDVEAGADATDGTQAGAGGAETPG